MVSIEFMGLINTKLSFYPTKSLAFWYNFFCFVFCAFFANVCTTWKVPATAGLHSCAWGAWVTLRQCGCMRGRKLVKPTWTIEWLAQLPKLLAKVSTTTWVLIGQRDVGVASVSARLFAKAKRQSNNDYTLNDWLTPFGKTKYIIWIDWVQKREFVVQILAIWLAAASNN